MTNFSLVQKKRSISVRELFTPNEARFKTRLVSGTRRGLDRKIKSHEIHYPGLALSGFMSHFDYKQVQVLSDMEWHYLDSLSKAKRKRVLAAFCKQAVPVIVLTHGRRPHDELMACAEAADIPVLQSRLAAPEIRKRLTQFLDNYFASKTTIHASLVDVYGIGLLYTGRSGIGKSECALDLIERGHRLVADDIITITRRGDNLVGQGSSLLGHHMEIRGVGIIDIQSLFGIRAIRVDKKIEVMVELVEWDPKRNYERLGLSDNKTTLLGVEIDKVTIPIFPGKNITVISEVIAMNMLLKYNGINTAKEFNQKLINTLKEKQLRKTHKKGD